MKQSITAQTGNVIFIKVLTKFSSKLRPLNTKTLDINIIKKEKKSIRTHSEQKE